MGLATLTARFVSKTNVTVLETEVAGCARQDDQRPVGAYYA